MTALEPNQVVGFVLLDLILILLVARLVGRLFLRIGQPRVMGEIVAGVLLGPTLLGPALWPDFQAPGFLECQAALVAAPPGTVASPTWCLFPAQSRQILGNIGQIALLVFMYLTGLEVDSELLKGKLRGIFLVGLGVVVVPIGLGFLVGPMLTTELFKPEGASAIGFVLFVGAMMAVTAFPVMVRILQEKGLTLSPMGATGIAAAAVCTVAMFVAVAVASSLSIGAEPETIAIQIALSLAYLLVMHKLIRPVLAWAARPYQASGRLDSGFFALAIGVLLASSYVAHLLGLSVIVGGFIAGLVMPVRKPLFNDMEARLGELTRTVLLPVFLAFSGLSTDFTRLSVAAAGGLAVLVLAGVAGKWAGGAVFARLGGFTWTEGNVLGILMNCRGLLVLVVALIGVQNGVITPVMQLGGVAMALITTAMTGPLFDFFTSGSRTGPQVLAPGPAIVASATSDTTEPA